MSAYIFITGGVVSSLGKGVVSASLGLLLRGRGLKVSFLKFDPYLNRDAGTMDPGQHGEVYVTEDGAETDLDLGHYERFADVTLGKQNNVTTGQIYGRVLERERSGGYGGDTVQVIPHVTGAIKDAIAAASDGDVTLVELGGTIGDIEGMPFVEAIRQFMLEKGKSRAVLLHLVLLPGLLTGGPELKTKPAQHSCQKLRECGLHMDYLLCRTEGAVSSSARDKLALHTNIRPDRVIEVPDAPVIYNVPERLFEQGLDAMICERLGLAHGDIDMTPWRAFSAAVLGSGRVARIAVVGQSPETADCHKSLNEALLHAAAARGAGLRLDRVDAEALEAGGLEAVLRDCAGLVAPDGIGGRGVPGDLEAIRLAREGGTPFLGLGRGFRSAVVEYARNVCGAPDAVSAEWAREGEEFPPGECWITPVDSQGRAVPHGGVLRLGSQPCRLEAGSLAREIYGQETVHERRRHRHEVNPDKLRILENHGLRISGRHPESGLAEIVELPGEGRWFVATQAHPEFKSRPLRPHPLFLSFIDAVLAKQEK